MNKTNHARKYNKKAYKAYTVRVRVDSPLEDRLEEYLATGETSVNFLVNKLLCEYFDVPLHHKWYNMREVTRLV